MNTIAHIIDPTLENLIAIIADQFGCEVSEISPASTLRQLGLDTLDFIELVLRCEEEFCIDTGDLFATECETVGDLYQAILATFVS